MSRGFDGFEIDDFRDSGSDSGRDVGRSSSSDWNTRARLHNIHREEDRADRLDREGRERSGKERPPLAREERVQEILSQRARTKYTDRDKDYSLRDSEIHTLSEVGKFRVVAANDLAEFAYNGDHTRMENDVESLARQGLVESNEHCRHRAQPNPGSDADEGRPPVSVSREDSSPGPSHLPRTQKAQRSHSRRGTLSALSQGCR